MGIFFAALLLPLQISMSLCKYDTFTATKILGKKIGGIKHNFNIRFYLIVPAYTMLTVLFLVVFTTSTKQLLLCTIINSGLLIFLAYFEYKILKLMKLRGFYEKGILYRKGAFIYTEIPEITLTDTGVEILGQNGVRERLETDAETLVHLKKLLFSTEMTVLNPDWQDNKTYIPKPYIIKSGGGGPL